MHKFMDVLKRFNIEPNDVSLFEHAFSHSSFVNENRGNHVDYERIEFIGDGVLDLVVVLDLVFADLSVLLASSNKSIILDFGNVIPPL